MTGDEEDLAWELGAAKSWLVEMQSRANLIPDYDPKIVRFLHAASALTLLLDAAGDQLSQAQLNALMVMAGRPEN